MTPLALLVHNPAYRAFWIARGISLLGDAAANVALVLYVVYQTGAGGGAVRALLLAGVAPRLLGPFAGALVDRADGRHLMIGCDLGQALLFGAIALILPPFPLLLLLVAAAATLATVFTPAGRSALPALVAADDLGGANALLGSAANLSLAFLARDVLAAPEAGYGLLASAYGMGMVLATVALILLHRGTRASPATLLLLGLAAQGLAGVGNGGENVATDTLIGRTVPRALLGRAFGIVASAAFVASGLAYAAGGPLLARTTPRAVFVIAGIGTLAAALVTRALLPRAPQR